MRCILGYVIELKGGGGGQGDFNFYFIEVEVTSSQALASSSLFFSMCVLCKSMSHSPFI